MLNICHVGGTRFLESLHVKKILGAGRISRKCVAIIVAQTQIPRAKIGGRTTSIAVQGVICVACDDSHLAHKCWRFERWKKVEEAAR